MELIFDVRKMTQAVVEMKYDVRKMPLGKLTHEQISAGYESLKAIETLLKVWHPGMAYCPWNGALSAACLCPLRTFVHLFTFPPVFLAYAVQGQAPGPHGRQQRLLHANPSRVWNEPASGH